MTLPGRYLYVVICYRGGNLSIRSLSCEPASSCGRKVTRHMPHMKKPKKRWLNY